MNRLAIVEPMTLVGHELREILDSQRDLWDTVELLTSDADEIGAVTEVAGRAALVQRLDSDTLSSVDLVVFCGAQIDLEALRQLPETAMAIFVDPLTQVPDAVPVVAGVNLDRLGERRRVISPNPVVILLSRLLHPLLDCGLQEVVAHALLPASARDQKGLDELFEQTRAILSMSDDRPEMVFGTQLAFNLLPSSASGEELTDQLAAVLESDLNSHVHLTQAGVFHCYSAGVFLRLERDPGLERLREALTASPYLAFHDEPEQMGPVAAAACDRVLLGTVTPAPPSGYWLWSAMDNLTCGGAANAFAIASSSANEVN